MKKQNGFGIQGTLTIRIERADGSILTIANRNMVVTGGLVKVATVLAGGIFGNPLTHIALGSSSQAPALTDTALISEVRRDAAVVSQLAPPNNTKVQFQKIHAKGAVLGTFREAGLFDAASAGAMFNRLTFTEFVVGVTDTLTTTWLLEVKNP